MKRWGLPEDPATDSQPGLGALWAVVVRNRLLILGSMLLVGAAVAYYTSTLTPVFSASTTLRIRAREPNLPDIYRTIASGSSGELATEIAVLGSRALKEDAAAHLGLQLTLLEPARVARGKLIRTISVSPDAPYGQYRLQREADGRFAVFAADSSRQLYRSGPDGRVQVPGATFVLTPRASSYDQIIVGVTDPLTAVGRLSSVSVYQVSRDADIIALSYSDVDSLLVAEVPNVIAARYLARRQQIERAEAGSAARFLREQVQRVSVELADAEETLRSFREREQVLDPQVETSAGVQRLVATESERASLEAERQALLKSLATIDNAAKRPGGDTSAYRRLSALPFVLRNEATSGLLSALMTAESERAGMIGVRPDDPDMKVQTAKIDALEHQLHSAIQTYLQGLANRVTSLDSTLGLYGRELRAIPRKQLEYARLERHVKGLESVYTLLQTRLNEAEIVEAVTDASVQVVDSALTPLGPSYPEPLVNTAAGLAVGLMLGIGLACVREYRDRSVHSRRDVMVATGVPVIGLIPRIPHASGRVALITGRRKLKGHPAMLTTPQAPAVGNGRHSSPRTFTFLASEPLPAEVTPAPETEPARLRPLPAAGLELTVNQWTNMLAEAYSLLLTNITFARTDPPTKIVVVTSPVAEDGKSTCALNLAITLALRGGKVLLVDADLRRGVVHTTLGVERGPGLSEVLAGSRPPEATIRTMKVGDHGGLLHFLPTGAVPPNPSALLESAAYQALLDRLKDEYETIIIDSPPVNVISDASILGLRADTVLLVARAGVTESSALRFAVEQLTRVGVPVLGVVLNDIDFKREAMYDASYRGYGASQYLSAVGGS